LPFCQALLDGPAVDLGLDRIELLDALQSLFGNGRFGLIDIYNVWMRHLVH